MVGEPGSAGWAAGSGEMEGKKGDAVAKTEGETKS